MKKYILAGIIASAPLLASTGAQAVTVDPPSKLTVTISGGYSVEGGGALEVGSTLNLTGAGVTFIGETNPGGIDLEGLSNFTPVAVPAQITLGDGAVNNDLSFSFDNGDVFSISDSFGANVMASGAGASNLFGLGDFDGNDASFSWGTTITDTEGPFQISFSIPPEVMPPELTSVPLPASGLLIFGALGGLLGFRRFARS